MELQVSEFGEKSRLRALLDHFGKIEDPREPWRVAHPLPEVLFLVVCGTVADCDDYEGIAAWGGSASLVPAPLPALLPRGSGRALADAADEPDRSRDILGLLHRLGPRDLARAARLGRHRRQDLEA